MSVKKCVAAFSVLINLVESGNMEGHIVGGDYADIENFAHSAYMYVSSMTDSGMDGGFTCGSSIINQAVMLTAAHCFDGCTEHWNIYAFVGHENVEKATSMRVLTYKIHEKYDTDLITNDIALYIVENNVKFGKKVRRVALMPQPPYHAQAVVAGWGLVAEDSYVASKKLKYAKQKVWSRARCQSLIADVPDGAFCAGYKNGDDYAAQGDSGSALLVQGYIQIGLVSYKDPSVSRSVVIYTDVGFFYPWIQRQAKLLFCQRPKRRNKSHFKLVVK